MADLKPIIFCGNSLDDLRSFPCMARREAGHQLDQVQNGLEPDDWKPMKTIGPGVKEIRIRDDAGAFGLSTLPNSPMGYMSFTAFRKRQKKPARKTWIWPQSDITMC